MAKRESLSCLTVSAEISKSRLVRLDVKLVVSDFESEDIIWQQTRNSTSKITEEEHQWITRAVFKFVVKLVRSGVCLLFKMSLRLSRRGVE
jgi:hypothetical protein